MTLEPTYIGRKLAVAYNTYANFPTSGAIGDLAYATDRLTLYRWDGAAWQAITIYAASGLAAAIPLAAGLPNGSLYFETDTGILKQVQAGAWAAILNQDVGSGHIVINPGAYDTIVQGTWIYLHNSGNFQNGFLYNSSHAQNDELTFKVHLAKGTYTIMMLVSKSTSCAIATMSLDGVSVATLDTYNNGNLVDSRVEQADIAVATSGLKTLSMKLATRNGGAIDWYIQINFIEMWRTA